MILENQTFRNRFMRALDIARVKFLKVKSHNITSTPILIDNDELITSTPLFPFRYQMHGEIQGSIFFSSFQKKIPFTQFELSQTLKRYFFNFGEALENQTNFLVGMTEGLTPEHNKLPHILTPMKNNPESFFLKQTLNIEKNNGESVSVLVLFALTPNHKTALEI